jgi:hypothetical protein
MALEAVVTIFAGLELLVIADSVFKVRIMPTLPKVVSSH